MRSKIVELVIINEQLKRYNIKQSSIVKQTGLTPCMVSRYLSFTKPKNQKNGELILKTAKALIANAECEVKNMVNK